MRSSHSLDAVPVIFDDDHAVANAGLVLPATLAQHLGIEAAADEIVDLGERPGAFRPGRKLLTLVHAMIVGGDCIDDAELLRCADTDKVLGHRVMAPSTLGTFLRSFTFGHVRQLDKWAGVILARAWAAGAGPGDGVLTMDFDSTVCEVHGYQKQGAAYGYTRQLGYHPLLATRADTGEVLHCRQRKGSANSGRGALRFLDETVPRVRRAGATGQLRLRGDSGFWSQGFLDACRRHRIEFSVTVASTKGIKASIASIPEESWVAIDYTASGEAQVAETTYKGDRLIVRRTRLIGPQAELWPNWRHHGFVTNRSGAAQALDAEHRNHAVIELAIRDLKEGSGLNHCPSGKFWANSAWLVLAALAHNLIRWVAALGLKQKGPVVTATLRRRLLTVPGRLTRSARRLLLHLPTNWPWARDFSDALVRLRAVVLTG